MGNSHRNYHWALSAAVIGIASFAVSHPGAAQSAAEFYKGKTVTLYTGHSPGGSYSTYARTLQRNIGRFIPGNPTVIFKVKTGGSGRVLANWMYNVAPRDGTVFGTFHERMGMEPRVYPKVTIGGNKAKRKALKVGMSCAITYPGNMGQAKKVACK